MISYFPKLMVVNPYVILTTLRSNPILINTQTGRMIFLNEAGKKVFEKLNIKTPFSIELIKKQTVSPFNEFINSLVDQGVFVEDGQWLKDYDYVVTDRQLLTDPEGVHICFQDVCIEVIVENSETRHQIKRLYAPYVCSNVKYCEARVIVKSGNPKTTSQEWLLDEKIAGIHIYRAEKEGMITGEGVLWHWSQGFQIIEGWINNQEVTLESLRIFVDLAIDRALCRRGLVSIHAAALLLHNLPLLLIGESGSGKTTLLMDIVSRHAATALSDDRVYLQAARKKAIGYLPGIIVNDKTLNNGLQLCLIQPARHFIEAEAIRSMPKKHFSPKLLVVLKRKEKQAYLRNLDNFEATKCLAELALTPHQRTLIKETSHKELIDRFNSIECMIGRVPIIELPLSTNFRQAADMLVKVVKSGKPFNSVKNRNIFVPDSIEESIISRIDVQKKSHLLIIDVFGMPVALYGSTELLSMASKEFRESNLKGSLPVYEIYIDERYKTVSENLSMVWRSLPLGLTLWEGKRERRFVFDNGTCIRHLKNKDVSIIEIDDLRIAYPLLRATISHVAQRLAVKKGWIIFHSGLVSTDDGHSIMVIGPKGSGKSLCCLWLSEIGYKLITDELVAIDPLQPELMALGLNRDISVRMDAAKLFTVKENMQFPFGGEDKAILDLPVKEYKTQFTNVVSIVRPSICNIDKVKKTKMTESESQRELFRASVGDCGEIPWGQFQLLTFHIAKRILVEALYLSTDLPKSRESVQLLYGDKQCPI